MSGRHAYLVAYDIADSRRLRQVHKLMRGHGDPLQFSLFRCRLSRLQKERLVTELTGIVEVSEDRILIVDLGPAEGTRERAFEYLGRPLRTVDEDDFIV